MFNFTIRLRLIGTMAFMAVMLFIGGAMGIFGVNQSNDIIREIFTNQIPALNSLQQSRVMLLRARTSIDRAIAHPEAADVSSIIKKSEEYLQQSNEAFKKYLSLPQDPDEKKMSDDLAVSRDKFINEGYLKMLDAIKAGNKDEADRVNMQVVPPAFTTYSDKISALGDYQIASAEKNYNQSKQNFTIFVWVDIFGVAGGLIAVAISAYFLLRAIAHPLHQALDQFRAIGNGDLTQQLKPESKDEMGELVAGLENMRQSLVQTVSMVRQSSGSIEISAGEIASGNMDLSSRTEQQAASLEETASSMEQLTSTVQQNADNARQANTQALAASEVAVRGGEVVGNVVHTMSSIRDSSNKIVDIIGVIDGIAFQTNILALNAAVEAARAGEQGRGFAVVASEVRSLAQRSANAAKEIKELIGDSVNKVEEGSRQVDDAGKTMNEIVNSIRNVADIMAEITAASVEQRDGISQVNLAIGKMDEATQQNAALVEQAAAAATSMQEQAAMLNQAVGIFKLDAAEKGRPQPKATPAPAPAAPQAAAAPKSISRAAPKASAAKPKTEVKSLPPAGTGKKSKAAMEEGDWEEF